MTDRGLGRLILVLLVHSNNRSSVISKLKYEMALAEPSLDEYTFINVLYTSGSFHFQYTCVQELLHLHIVMYNNCKCISRVGHQKPHQFVEPIAAFFG